LRALAKILSEAFYKATEIAGSAFLLKFSANHFHSERTFASLFSKQFSRKTRLSLVFGVAC